MTPRKLATLIAKAAEDIQAADVVVLDLTLLTSFTDYFVICSGKSDTQVRAIADSIVKKLKENGREATGVEGKDQASWILIDFGDVVAHVFYHDARYFYNLDKLWSDAPVRRVAHH